MYLKKCPMPKFVWIVISINKMDNTRFKIYKFINDGMKRQLFFEHYLLLLRSKSVVFLYFSTFLAGLFFFNNFVRRKTMNNVISEIPESCNTNLWPAEQLCGIGEHLHQRRRLI